MCSGEAIFAIIPWSMTHFLHIDLQERTVLIKPRSSSVYPKQAMQFNLDRKFIILEIHTA